MIINFPRIPKVYLYPLLVLIVSIPFIIANLVFEIDTHPFNLFAIAGVIIFQICMGRRNYNTCGTCGHERYMHDKRELLRKTYAFTKNTLTGLARVVCDNFRKGKCEKNYEKKYWNGEDTIEKWDTNRDR